MGVGVRGGSGEGAGRDRSILMGRVKFHRTKACYWIPVMILWIITSTIPPPPDTFKGFHHPAFIWFHWRGGVCYRIRAAALARHSADAAKRPCVGLDSPSPEQGLESTTTVLPITIWNVKQWCFKEHGAGNLFFFFCWDLHLTFTIWPLERLMQDLMFGEKSSFIGEAFILVTNASQQVNVLLLPSATR